MSFRQAGAIGVFCLSMGAQQRPVSVPAKQPATETASASSEIRRFADLLSGAWSITLSKVERNGIERVTGHGEGGWKFEPGAFFVEENRLTDNGKPAEDSAAIWWDGKARKIRGIRRNALSSDEGCSGFDVMFNDNESVMSGVWGMRGTRFAWREVFTVSPDAKLTQTLYTAEAGKDSRLAEILRGTRR